MSQTLAVEPLENKTTNGLLPVLLLLFIGSGCAALIYEVVWLQMLQLVIGSTAHSMAVILGAYMGGMCLGSLLFPYIFSPKLHPLRVYAILELVIGVSGVLVYHFMPEIEQFYTKNASHSLAVRGMVAGGALLLPTIMMGATLPAISRWIQSSKQGISWLGFFYGGNIVGAVIGCLLAGFYLLPKYNMMIASYSAVGINVLVCAVGLIISFNTTYTPSFDKKIAQRISGVKGAGWVYLTIALSGFTGLGAEVVWTRLLSYQFGATVYTFSVILAVFLFGLGIGSSVGSGLARSLQRPRIALGWCQALLVASMGWTAWVVCKSLPYWPINPGMLVVPHDTVEYGPIFQLDLIRCAWAILPGTLLWGASFPLALAAVTRPGQDAGRQVGKTYAANTVGAILGALAFSIFIVAAKGTQFAQQVLVAVSALSAVVCLLPIMLTEFSDDPEAGFFSTGGVLVSIIAGGLVWYMMPPPSWQAMAYGRHSAWFMSGTEMPDGVFPQYSNDDTVDAYKRYCVYEGEGMNVSAVVSKWGNNLYFHGAGKVQASTDPADMHLQRMLGHITALTVKKPENVLVIACGAGVTAGSFVPYEEVKRIVICDIEPLVPTKVTPNFFKQNYNITNKITADNRKKTISGKELVPWVDSVTKKNNVYFPGVDNATIEKLPEKEVEVYFDDGRHYIRTTQEKFDVITSDPIDPWVKGCAALNTIEYYQMCKSKLKPGGVMALWIPLYESDEKTINSVLTTFFEVFPKGILWTNDVDRQGYDAVLFGQAEGTEIDLDEMQKRIDAQPLVKQSLMDVNFPSAASLMGTFAVDAKHLKDGGWMDPQYINRDSNLRLQYLAGLGFNNQTAGKLLSGILKHYTFPQDIFKGSPESLSALKQELNANARYERSKP